MKKFILLVSIVLFISCAKDETSTFKEMKADTLLSESFSTYELNDLAKIVDFFESQICKKYGDLNKCDIQKAYKKFNVADSISYPRYLNFIDFKKQKELYNKITPKLKYKIWAHPFTIEGKKEIKDVLWIRGNGDYINFLKRVGNSKKEFEIFKKYAEEIELSNDLSVKNEWDLALNYRFYDSKDIKFRLLIAIHYLSLNEQFIQPQLIKK
ncbi:hypothetical protein [Polaribacter uvawellassae]|uniref:hypothetical protein n=1 Tax=Polaribacter uvawellassae TaxID=3133495 RepID=UPI00321B90CB